MAENRRVEARSIIGNGNATDPETIVELEDEWARRVRGNTPKPKKKFGAVVEEESQKRTQTTSEAQEAPPVQTRSKEHLPKTIEPRLGVRLIKI